MKKLFLVLMLLAIVLTAGAIPAQRVWRTVTQSDGTTLELMQVGDEHLHYFITRDNVPVVEVKGSYEYADGVGFGMTTSGMLAHEAAARTAYERDFAAACSQNRIEAVRAFVPSFSKFNRIKKASATAGYSSDRRVITGKHRNLVILVNFSNKKFLTAHDSAYFNSICNTQGYTNTYGAIGSLHDYFYAQSNGKLDLTFDVVGPLNLSNTYSYYGRNDAYGNDANTFEMVAEACELADSLRPDLNWKDYDWDNDGVVDQVYVIYAGPGEATGGASSTVWPAASSFDDWNAYVAQYGGTAYNLAFDGVRINSFAYGNEINGASSSTTPMGIGVMAHEFSHCLGFPDLYDIAYGGAYGMGSYDLMDHGSYGGPSDNAWVPVGYSSYEKWAAGWIDYKELKGRNDTITGIQPQVDNGPVYAIYNDSVRNLNDPDRSEYILLDNRTAKGWDAYLPGSGIMAIHVNYVKSIWDDNYVNTPSYSSNGKQNLTLYHANNSTYYTWGDLYPYNGNDSLTDTSKPSMSWYNVGPDKSLLAHKPVVQMTYDSNTQLASFIYNPVDTLLMPKPVITGKNYFRDSTQITLSADSGTVYYSTGSTDDFKKYEKPFMIYQTTTVKAYTDSVGMHRSATVSATFTMQQQLPAPTVTVDTLSSGSLRFTLKAARGSIRYSYGSGAFKVYYGALTVSDSTQLNAFCTTTDKAYYNSDTIHVTLVPTVPLGIGRVSQQQMSGRVRVYSLDGAQVAEADDIRSIQLKAGTYVVADEKGATRKLIIR